MNSNGLVVSMSAMDWIAASATALCGAWFVVGFIAALGGRRNLLKPLASLKFTVVLFSLALALIFFGTLAQVDAGIWTVLHSYFRTWMAQVECQGLIRFGQTFFHVSPEAHSDLIIPFPGGYTLGWLMMFNLLAAHFVRFKLTWKRAGVVVTHVGIILMLVGELITSVGAHESNMSINVGQTVRHSEDSRTMELAIIDPSDPRTQNVVAVPLSRLLSGGVITNSALPFDIKVHRYMRNAELLPVTQMMQREPNWSNPVTFGDGLRWAALEVPPFSGTTNADRVDEPAAYLTLLPKSGSSANSPSSSLGTCLLALQLAVRDMPQQIVAGDKRYDLYLRWERTYYPFEMTLTEFNHGYYPGTGIPNNFESQLRLVNAQSGEDRQVNIHMNNPLRYAGLTFYQSQFKRGGTGTVLQVVRNPGWVLPYISCIVVALGMTGHFLIVLTQFARRSAA